MFHGLPDVCPTVGAISSRAKPDLSALQGYAIAREQQLRGDVHHAVIAQFRKRQIGSSETTVVAVIAGVRVVTKIWSVEMENMEGAVQSEA